MDEYSDSLRSVDSFLSEFVVENKYNNTLYFQNQFLLEKLLGEDLSSWVSWFLYEMPLLNDDDTPNCSVDGVEYLVNDLTSFMDFARHGLLLPMKPTEIFDEKDN